MNIRGSDFIYYQTNDMDKAIAFYRDALGLEMYGQRRQRHLRHQRVAKQGGGGHCADQRESGLSLRLRPRP